MRAQRCKLAGLSERICRTCGNAQTVLGAFGAGTRLSELGCPMHHVSADPVFDNGLRLAMSDDGLTTSRRD